MDGQSLAQVSRRWTVGVCCIVLVAIVWSASSVLVQAIFTEENFVRPFFLTWVSNSLFFCALPLRSLSLACSKASSLEPAQGTGDEHSDTSVDGTSTDGNAIQRTSRGRFRLPERRTVRAALIICPIWFGANLSYNVSMSMTSISASTVISSSSSAFTLLLSAVVLREPLSALKIFGVLLCWTGNALQAVGDDSSSSLLCNASSPADNSTAPDGGDGPSSDTMLLGDAICLLSALLYSVYTVCIKRAEVCHADRTAWPPFP